MTVLVTCGFHDTWCDYAQSRLGEMGVSEPIIAERLGLSPAQITEKMYRNLALHGEGEQVTGAHGLGQAWQVAAADLFIANSGTPLWGWADPLNLRFLDFWRDFDPNCKFMLIYSSPAQSLARRLAGGFDVLDAVDDEFQRWQNYHELLLRFYQSNPESSVLTCLSAFEDNASQVTKMLTDHLDIPARRLNTSRSLQQSKILELIAAEALGNRSEDNQLLRELDSSANLPRRLNGTDAKHTVERAQNEYASFQSSIELLGERNRAIGSLEQDLSSLDEKLSAAMETNDSLNHANSLLQLTAKSAKEEHANAEKLNQELNEQNVTLQLRVVSVGDELEAAQSQLLAIKRDLETASGERDSLQEQNASLSAQIEIVNEEVEELKRLLEARQNSEGKASEEANSLLKLQLKQVREELELYFGKYQKLKEAENARRDDSVISASSDLNSEGHLIDLRNFVSGDGWHDAEQFGRWAGFSTSSTLDVSRLSPGDYVMEVRIVDAMALDIVQGLSIRFNGSRLNVKRKILADMGGRLAPLRRLKASWSNVEKPYPILVTARISAALFDQHSPSQTLVLDAPRVVSPAEQLGTDSRKLSFCVESIRFLRVE